MYTRGDYGFELPDDRIAQSPAQRRGESRLLVVGPESLDCHPFADLVGLLPERAVVVINDTRVVPARLHTRKDTGGAVELLFVEIVEPTRTGERWRCMARSHKPLRKGAALRVVDADVAVTVTGERDASERHDGTVIIDVVGSAEALLGAHGEVPLPPYIHRPVGASSDDAQRYQTVYARRPGAVAAPTAGLHLTRELLDAIEARGCELAPITLHVGPGTFAPVRVDRLDDIELHPERYEIPERSAELISSDRPVVAIGTTSVRAVEAAADERGRVRAGAGTTRLFIRPGHRFAAVDHLVTNFHLPESTLLMLVCAFGGYDRLMAAYRHAVDHGEYRFYSYGDAMYLSRAG